MWFLILMSVGSMSMAKSPFSITISDYIQKENPGCTSAEAQVIASAIYKYSVAYGIDPRLVAALIRTESRFNQYAVGKAGEIGLMQLHPKFHNTSFDVDDNISVGVRYLVGIRSVFLHNFKGINYVEMYNRGPFAKKPKLYPYAERVLLAYKELGGHVDPKENTPSHPQRAKNRGSKYRRIASTSP